ncbi:peptide chain release factor H [Ruminiclostridium herbifermentans]|uniref:Peptide chain release factor H n=1 Tax=Ruminiclostridium herbifermentans TaxID=2488810 RepID=A0A4U7JHV2_9FIRM|nr:peptide chain release factor H [Ruminiclostridium herbifermentans]QNU67527.1 peptide chain release factor H [Ruminiclostridium herbifermentans]
MWIQISSGKGPDECELAVSLFLESCKKECKKNNIKATVIDAVLGHISGNLKSALLSLEGNEHISIRPSNENHSANAYNEIISGTILWICNSPYRPNHKRKNWFINIEVFKNPDKLNFFEKDVRFESMRSSGPGGQNVNKVETAVRAVHIPTGLTVTASEERSQYMNKKLALSRLSMLIEEKNTESFTAHKKKLWIQHNTLERGNPFRIYEGREFRLKQK